jgi:DNA transposition AAA+ family ATPase
MAKTTHVQFLHHRHHRPHRVKLTHHIVQTLRQHRVLKTLRHAQPNLALTLLFSYSAFAHGSLIALFSQLKN